MSDNYDKILDRIAKSSGIERIEIERRVEAKREKLSGLISREGAAQVIAAELGVNFDNEKFKIDELLPGMRKVQVSGKVLSISPVRNFTTKKGTEGKVCNLVIADDTSNIKVVLWDANHISLVENETIKIGSSIELVNGSMRDGEIHLGSFSELKKSDEKFEDVMTGKVVKTKSISDFNVNDSVTTRAFIVQSFDPRFFNVCPECKKKVTQNGEDFTCNTHGKVTPGRRALINIVIDDGTETMRTVIFHDNLDKLGFKDLSNAENVIVQKQNMLGKEFIFSGDIRLNKFFNNPELIINSIKDVNMDTLLSELQ